MNKVWKSLTAAGLALSLLPGVIPYAVANGAQRTESTGSRQVVDLVPDTPNDKTPNYVCTWSWQDWTAYSKDFPGRTPEEDTPRAMLNHERLFNKETGLLYTAYPEEVRKDLIFLLDDGWDLDYNDQGFGSLEVKEDKFPNYGETPAERLKTLVKNIEDAGWKGAGIWICAGEKDGENGKGWNEEYWRERLQWSAEAGVDYWKIDWGGHSGDSGWRQMISRLADEIAPDLVIEHITGYGPVNNGGNDGSRLNTDSVLNSAYFASFSDVYRTYDVTGNLSIPTTFERIGRQLEQAYTNGEQLGLINGEDEMYMCAALGLTFGVMRYDIGEAGSGSLPNIFFGGDETFTETRPLRKMLDEVSRTVMWQRIAPAYRMDAYSTQISSETLTDSWTYTAEDTWYGSVNGQTVRQSAPAVIARGMDLSDVTVETTGEKPFVAVSRNPNGAVAVGTYGRTTPDQGYQAQRADITVNVKDLTGKIGVFGYYDSLTLQFDESIAGKTVYAQDLLADSATDITQDPGVTISQDGTQITLSGELLENIGHSAKTEDYSEPGLVLQIGEEREFEPAPETNYVPESTVPNGSFELVDSNGTLLCWKTWGDNTFELVEDDARSGQQCVKYSSDQDYRGGMYQTVKDIPSGIYDISLWVKASEHTVTEADPDPCCITVKDYGGEMQYAKVDPSQEWTQVKVAGVPITSGKVTIELYSYAKAGEYVFFDDFELTKSGDVSAYQQLIESALERNIWDNDVTDAQVKETIETVLQGTEITAEVADFTVNPSNDDVEGWFTCTVKLTNRSGESVTFPYRGEVPRTSLIMNPSMEINQGTGTVPEGWQAWGTSGKFYAENKDEDPFSPRTGDWYGICWGQNYEGGLYQVVQNLPNGKYKASVWVKNSISTNDSASPSAACFVVKDFGQGITGDGLRYVDIAQQAHDTWTQLVIEDIPVTNGKMQIEFYAKADSGENEWIVFDDFALEAYIYEVTCEKTANGTLQTNPEKATEGTRVEIEALPENGYRIKDGTLRVYRTGYPEQTVEVTDQGFIMPGYPVTVTAEFESATPVVTELKVSDVDFGEVMQGETLEALPVVITNTGSTDVTVDQVTISGTSFKLTGSGTSIPAGETMTSYLVQPKQDLQPGDYAETVTVSYGGKEATAKITVTVLAKTSCDKTLLQKTYDYALKQDTSNLVPSAKEKFDAVMAKALSVLEDETATQEQVNATWNELVDVIHALGLVKGDKTMLELLIERADGMMENADKYMTDTWQQLVDALAKAKDVCADGDAMDQDIQPVAEDLLSAILAQRFKADKSILEDLIGKAKGMDLTGYTVESVEVFRTALAQAQAVLADETLTEDDQATVDAAVEQLARAMDALTAEGAPEATDKPETTDKPEATDKPQATQKPENNVPQTGDHSQITLWVTLMGLCAASALTLVAVKGRRKVK